MWIPRLTQALETWGWRARLQNPTAKRRIARGQRLIKGLNEMALQMSLHRVCRKKTKRGAGRCMAIFPLLKHTGMSYHHVLSRRFMPWMTTTSRPWSDNPSSQPEHAIFLWGKYREYFETKNKGMENPSRLLKWPINAVGLSSDILAKIYHLNAKRYLVVQ